MCAIELEPVIETQRLRLRRPRRMDAARIAELANDFDLARMTTSMPHPYGIADAEAYLAAMDEGPADRQTLFVIEHPAEGAVKFITKRDDRTYVTVVANPANAN